MGIKTFNATQSAKGLQGTNRQANATFSGLSGVLQEPPQGMAGPQGPATPAAPQGSSYNLAAGMQGTGRNSISDLANPAGGIGDIVPNMADDNGVIAGKQGVANVGQIGPQLTAAQMQDPENAAMAGFQFAQGQDQTIQHSAPVYVPPQPKPGGPASPMAQPAQPGISSLVPMGPPKPNTALAPINQVSPKMKPPTNYGNM